MSKIRKILIANRGEIAVRVIRSAREMGIKTAAIYSDVDRSALHVAYADEAYPLGASKPSESYLNIPKIIGIAKKCSADAIHPGYGFLAENPSFAKACEEAKLIFIGPSADAMSKLGSKLEARALMEKSGVPVVPGSSFIRDIEDAKEKARSIGYPVMIKASAGGGGKGMRLVREESEIASSLAMAMSEARNAFGDETVYFEKYLENPRHIEVQILSDGKRAAHLGERECSVQRRHQKVLEECPSPFVDDKLRNALGEAAVRAALASNYCGAGTVEFLVSKDKKFYFLEVNTRIQVEHPITEMVTGVDIVKEQILIAEGEPLRLKQKDIAMRGWAIECRIYAEDPENDFLPSPGRITDMRLPGGPGIRNDIGITSGSVVPPDYDPIVGKLIVWGIDRDEAIRRLTRALEEYRILGIKTTIAFHKRAVSHPAFLKGEYDTSFIARHSSELFSKPKENIEVALIAAVLSKHRRNTRKSAPDADARPNLWRTSARAEGLRKR